MPKGVPHKSEEDRAEARRAAKKRWRDQNRERHREICRDWYHANKERALATTAAWSQLNPERKREHARRYEAKNPERNKQQRGDRKAIWARYVEKNLEKLRASRRAHQARRRSDPVNRIFDTFSRRFRHVMAGTARSSVKALGYTSEELRSHIEAQFEPGMSWENYGEWHVDHKRPVSSFKLPEQMLECWALSNLRPLWAPENLKKHARWEDDNCPGPLQP